MAFRFVSRALVSNSSLASRSSSSVFAASSPHVCARPSLSVFSLLRPLSAAVLPSSSPAASGLRHFSTRQTTSSLNDPSPNWSNRPPKETILLDGCDFEHWLCVMEPPEGDPTRDEIIDSYIKTLATVVGSEEEARMKIYSVSTKCYFAFGALVSEDVSLKIKELPKVRWVLPDSYLDVKNKDYGGEPFINGQAVPYDPKYHEEWIRNNNRANERNRRNDRPRNFDRSRNFERRQQNVQTQPPMHNQNSNAPPMHNQNSNAPPMHNQNSNAPPMNNQSSNFAPSNQNFMRPMQNHMAPPQSQAQNSPVPPMHNQNINFVPPTQNMQSMPNRMGPPLNNNMPPPPSHMPNNNMPPPQMPNNSMRPPQMPNNNMPPPQMPNNNMPPPQMPNNNMPPPQMPNNNMPPPHMQYNHTPPPHLQNMSNPMSPQGQQQQNIPPVPNTSPNSGWPSNMAGPGSSIQNNAGWSGSGRE